MCSSPRAALRAARRYDIHAPYSCKRKSAARTASPGRRSVRGLGEGFHHEPGAAARDVRDDRRAAVQLGDAAEVDGEGQHHLLTLAQAEIGGLDEHAGGGEIERLAE